MPANRPRQFGWRPIEFAQYISPDGEVFKFDELDRFLISEEGLGMPGIKYIDQTGPFQHGKTIYDYRLEPRIIQLLFRENTSSRNNYWLLRREILNLLRPSRQVISTFNLGTLRRIMPDTSVFDIDCLIEQGPSFRARETGSWDEWSVMETIRFICPDPTFYIPTAIIETSVAAGGAMPNIDITYDGSWISYPTIVVTGPIDDLVITNTGTTEVLDLTGYSLAAGRMITFDLSFGNKTVIESVAGNIIGYLTDDSDVATFHLDCAPAVSGGLNTITIGGSSVSNGVTTVAFSYYKRYIGI